MSKTSILWATFLNHTAITPIRLHGEKDCFDPRRVVRAATMTGIAVDKSQFAKQRAGYSHRQRIIQAYRRFGK